jgi:formylglycine-generating enzyme required for sulfatase activity
MDMAGNVWEWCQSKFKPYPYKADKDRESLKGNEARVVRGGAFSSHRGSVRCAYRYDLHPAYRFSGLGFRVVVSPASRFSIPDPCFP